MPCKKKNGLPNGSMGIKRLKELSLIRATGMELSEPFDGGGKKGGNLKVKVAKIEEEPLGWWRTPKSGSARRKSQGGDTEGTKMWVLIK